jgi:hypothetical protein
MPWRASQVIPVSRQERKLICIVVELSSVRRARSSFAAVKCWRIQPARRFSLSPDTSGRTAAASSTAWSCIASSSGTSVGGMGTSRTPLRVFGAFTVFESSSYDFVTCTTPAAKSTSVQRSARSSPGRRYR